MKVNEFNQLKREVKKGNLKGLKKEVIKDLTLKQAQALEDALLDIELNNEGNKILDVLVEYIDSVALEEKKVANKKAPAPQKPTEAPQNEEKKQKGKKPTGQKKSSLKGNKPAEKKASEAIKEGQIIKFRVEDEEVEHNIKIVNIGKYHIIAVMEADEKEVFNIRKADFNKQVFEWTDRHNETYNIIVTI